MALQGIDVSNNNGQVDWARVARAGIAFAYIKSTEGLTFDDDWYARNREGAAKAGIPAGAYHFARPGNNTPEDEVQHFLTVAAPRVGELLPAVDLEHSAANPKDRAVSVANRLKWVRRFLQLMEKELGAKPVMYLNPDYGNNALKGGDFSAYPLWLAHYAAKPSVPGTWKNYAIWQFSEHGKVDGAAGDVDMNIASPGVLRSLKFGGEPPASLKNGQVVRPAGRKQVYLIDGGKKRTIPDARTLVSKWNWSDVVNVPQKQLGELPNGKPFASVDAPVANGDAIRATPSKTIFLVQGGKRRAFPDAATFLAKFEWYQVRVLPPEAVEAVPLGDPLPRT
jgi:GH25 family lysozyme M1 (1,4-beta-N-acetylmuramidase)